MSTDIREFIVSFLKKKGLAWEAMSLHRLQGDGSKRLFWRMARSGSDKGFIVMSNPPTDTATRRENLAYAMIGVHLRKKKIPVPNIYRHDLERGWFIMEDMGRSSLQDLLWSGKKSLPLYEKILEHLFRLQVEGASGFDPAWCCQTESYDLTVMRRYEANYFRDAFLKGYLGLQKEWAVLDVPFDHLAEMASRAANTFFMHRDFQSRNIMFLEGKIGIIDWQGGRLGPLGYDLASLIIDPYTSLTPREKEEIYQGYLGLLKEYDAGLVDLLRRDFPYLAIQRNLQILGAFSHLTKNLNKTYFEAYIPTALSTLHALLDQVNDAALYSLKELVADLKQLKKPLDMPETHE